MKSIFCIKVGGCGPSKLIPIGISEVEIIPLMSGSIVKSTVTVEGTIESLVNKMQTELASELSDIEFFGNIDPEMIHELIEKRDYRNENGWPFEFEISADNGTLTFEIAHLSFHAVIR